MVRRILIADDEAVERRALRQILQNAPEYELLEAANGLEGWALVEQTPPDLAILDIKMPGLDGISLAERIRAQYPEMAIVFLTAFDEFDYARNAIRLHVDDFLLKPASTEEVLATVKRVFSGMEDREVLRRNSEAALTRLDDAIELLAEKLRNDLAQGLPEILPIRKFLELLGRQGGCQALAELRPTHPGVSLPAVAALAERRLDTLASVVLAGCGRDSVRILFLGEAITDWSATIRHLRDQIRKELGAGVVAGVAVAQRPSQTPAPLVRAAHRAVSLATPASPVLQLTLEETGTLAPEGVAVLASDLSPAVVRTLELLESRHGEDLTLDSVAAEVGISPSHLSRLLARSTGRGFSDCLASFRIASAKAFLGSAGISIKEVAGLAGFHDPAYFARVFRRMEGCSPAEYRASKLAGGVS